MNPNSRSWRSGSIFVDLGRVQCAIGIPEIDDDGDSQIAMRSGPQTDGLGMLRQRARDLQERSVNLLGTCLPVSLVPRNRARPASGIPLPRLSDHELAIAGSRHAASNNHPS